MTSVKLGGVSFPMRLFGFVRVVAQTYTASFWSEYFGMRTMTVVIGMSCRPVSRNCNPIKVILKHASYRIPHTLTLVNRVEAKHVPAQILLTENKVMYMRCCCRHVCQYLCFSHHNKPEFTKHVFIH